MTAIVLAVLTLAAEVPGVQRAPGPVRFVVSPMALPKPALKYQLLPEVSELETGNPVQWYLRSFAEQRNFFFNKEVVAERARYRTMPLKDLPLDKLRDYGGSALTQADWGARLDTPDWQVLDRVRKEGADLRLPELSSLKVLAAALHVRFRAEVARRDFDAAIATAKTMFAFARHLGECPVTEASRVGLSAAGMALDALEEFVQQPGSPNLYWALTELPAPLVEIRKGLQGERAMLATELRSLRDDVVISERELDELIGRLSGRSGFARLEAGLAPRDLRSTIAALAKDAVRVDAARMRLIESGVKPWLVIKFPAVQVMLLVEKREFEIGRDDALKLLGLAPWEMASLKDNDRPRNVFADMLPRVRELRLEQSALDRRIVILRHVEAMRFYASGHDGQLPAALESVGVPLPRDPISGKDFVYQLDRPAARLKTSAISTAASELEITIRR
jgi:hypothetical protein